MVVVVGYTTPERVDIRALPSAQSSRRSAICLVSPCEEESWFQSMRILERHPQLVSEDFSRRLALAAERPTTRPRCISSVIPRRCGACSRRRRRGGFQGEGGTGRPVRRSGPRDTRPLLRELGTQDPGGRYGASRLRPSSRRLRYTPARKPRNERVNCCGELLAAERRAE